MSQPREDVSGQSRQSGRRNDERENNRQLMVPSRAAPQRNLGTNLRVGENYFGWRAPVFSKWQRKFRRHKNSRSLHLRFVCYPELHCNFENWRTIGQSQAGEFIRVHRSRKWGINPNLNRMLPGCFFISGNRFPDGNNFVVAGRPTLYPANACARIGGAIALTNRRVVV